VLSTHTHGHGCEKVFGALRLHGETGETPHCGIKKKCAPSLALERVAATVSVFAQRHVQSCTCATASDSHWQFSVITLHAPLPSSSVLRSRSNSRGGPLPLPVLASRAYVCGRVPPLVTGEAPPIRPECDAPNCSPYIEMCGIATATAFGASSTSKTATSAAAELLGFVRRCKIEKLIVPLWLTFKLACSVRLSKLLRPCCFRRWRRFGARLWLLVDEITGINCHDQAIASFSVAIWVSPGH
jgi:hypothetical protein